MGAGGGVLLSAPEVTVAGRVDASGGTSTINGGTLKVFACGSPSLANVAAGRLLIREHASGCALSLAGGWEITMTSEEWAAAETACVSRGGHLASLATPEENTFVTALAATIGPGSSFWIGYGDTVEGTFAWVDGTSRGFESWSMGEPNDGGAAMNQDCVDVNLVGVGLWNDRPCDLDLGYVCEQP